MKNFIKIILILLVIFIIAACVLAGYGYKKAKNFIVENSQEQAIELPQVAIAKDAFQEKRKSFDDFIDDLEDGKCENQYELTGEEANVVLKDNDDKLITKWVYLNVKDSKLEVTFSVPLAKALSEDFGDKYLNGSSMANFGYNLNDDNKVNFEIFSFKLGDKEFVEGESKKYSRDAQGDDFKEILKSVDKIYLEGDKVIITCKK